jgi:hypothetical protein
VSILVTIVADLDEDRLRRGLTALASLEPPALDRSPSRAIGWVGALAVGVATTVLLSGVLTVTLLLHHRAEVAATPVPRPTVSAAPSLSPEPTATPSPVATPAPIAYLPALGPLCSASELQVRVGVGFSALGNGVTYLIFTNRGSARCTLRGTPIIQLLDARGRPLSYPPVIYRASGYIPTLPNGGVGLLPLGSEGVSPGPYPEGGVRGQASLPFQYAADGCQNAIAFVRIHVDGGTFTIRMGLSGGGQPCRTTAVYVNPFQPAEYLP